MPTPSSNGTDVFGAIVLRPAIASVDDRTLTQLLGHVAATFATLAVQPLVCSRNSAPSWRSAC